MSTIIELQDKLTKLRETANFDVDSVPANIRTAAVSKRNNARENVSLVEAELRQTVYKSSAAVFVGGDEEPVDEFASGIEEEANGVVVHAASVYQKLANDIWPTVVDGKVNANHLPVFATALQSLSELLGVFVRVNPTIMGDFIARGKQYTNVSQFADDLQKAIRAVVGTELEVLFIQKTVTDVVLEGYEQNVVPVVVLGASKDDPLLKNLFDGDCFYVEVTKDEEQKQVKSALKSLKDIFKAKVKNNKKSN